MRKGIRQVGALMVFLLPLGGCLQWLDVADYAEGTASIGTASTGTASTGTAPPGHAQPQPVTGGSAPLRALCGEDSLEAVVPIACAKERGLCEQWAECAISTPVEECVAEREQECAERALVALQSGACFLPQIAATNAENGCHENWQSTLGACLLSTLQELTLAFEPCRDEWTPGNIPEGGACMYGVAGCAAADVPEREARCDYTSSFEPGGGLCLWHLDLPRGAACDPEQGAYCNGSDGCLSSGICDQRRELGEACEVDNDCASLLCAEGVCTDPHGFSCAERTCPSLWSCVDERCARVARL